MHSCTSHIRTGPDVIAHRHHSREQSEQQKKRKKGSEKKNPHREEREGQSRTQWGSEEIKRGKEEEEEKKNHRFVKRWVDCGHRTAYSGTNCSAGGIDTSKKQKFLSKGKITTDILSFRNIILCPDKRRQWPLSSRGTGISPLTALAGRGCLQMMATIKGCWRPWTAGKVPVWGHLV